jgi:hypothetical protein
MTSTLMAMDSCKRVVRPAIKVILLVRFAATIVSVAIVHAQLGDALTFVKVIAIAAWAKCVPRYREWKRVAPSFLAVCKRVELSLTRYLERAQCSVP